jgi:UDP-glucose:(heptosyl)LPS alpha-1,3-glucosyltransferase
MKIALVNKTFSLSHGGAERFSVNLAAALVREGHEVHAFVHQAEDLPDQVTLHQVSMVKKPAFRRVLSFASQVRRILASESFDIIYGLTQIYPQDLHRMGGGIHRHWMRVRYPFTPWRWLNYLFNPTHLANIFLESRIYRPANYRRIVTNSQLCKRHAQEYYGVPTEHIAVIYNGVDHQTFNSQTAVRYRGEVRQELGLSQDDPVILFVASNWKRKGLSVLLRALAILGSKGRTSQVVVVGRGKPDPFKKLARQLGLDGRVHFIGPTNRVERYYGAGDLLVLPTLYDPFANVCLEAMACGLPVITTAANGAAEIIRPGENGFVQQKPTDAQELALLLEPLLSAEHRSKMGQAARVTALEFTTERNLAETLGLCRRVLEEKRG